MIFVSVGVHTYLPPPPNHVPITIRSRLQELIHQADTDATDINGIIIERNVITSTWFIQYAVQNSDGNRGVRNRAIRGLCRKGLSSNIAPFCYLKDRHIIR